MSEENPELEIIRLWPSVFLECDVPGYEAPTQRFMALAESRSEEGVFAIDDPGVAWLKDQLARAVVAYLQRAGFAQVPTWGGRARFAVQDFGEYRTLANQPGADLAGMYVLQWPSQQSITPGRDDGLPGYVSFYDPRVAMNMNAIKRDPITAITSLCGQEPGCFSCGRPTCTTSCTPICPASPLYGWHSTCSCSKRRFTRDRNKPDAGLATQVSRALADAIGPLSAPRSRGAERAAQRADRGNGSCNRTTH